MRDDDDGVAALELAQELFDVQRRGWIEGTGRLVQQQHFRLHCQSTRDAQPLLLPAGQGGARPAQLILHLVQERGLVQAVFDQPLQIAAARQPVETQTGGHVVEDRQGRERVGPLEHHADAAAHQDRIGVRRVDIFALEQHAAFHASAGHGLMEAVQAADQRRLATTRWTDDGRHLSRGDVKADVAQCLARSVPGVPDARCGD